MAGKKLEYEIKLPLSTLKAMSAVTSFILQVGVVNDAAKG